MPPVLIHIQIQRLFQHMTKTTVTGTYAWKNWTEKEIETPLQLPSKHVVASMQRTFTSKDWKGEAQATYLMTKTQAPGDEWAFTGQQVFVGTLLGREGSFVCNAHGMYSDGALSCEWTIVPEATTGQLKGLTGHGGYKTTVHAENDPNHKDKETTCNLTVELPPA